MTGSPLSLREASDRMQVGAKALALGEMLREGFTVPDGFVVRPQPLDDAYRARILAAFEDLGSTYVAVRSSAVGEDNSKASWAGQLHTFLNVDRGHLLESIRECRKSVESAQALSYAAQRHVSSGNVAVIVQEMIKGDVSGVAFSVHPLTQDPKQIVIEAAYGFGEAVVNGTLTPDIYVVHKANNRVIEKMITAQPRRLSQGDAGTLTWEIVATARQASQKLNDNSIAKLSSLIRDIEVFYGFPVDVEWTLKKGRFYILQSRPITTLN